MTSIKDDKKILVPEEDLWTSMPEIQDTGNNRTDPNAIYETEQTKINTYKQRFYILAVYSLMTFTQGAMWNTWGPIAASSEDAFGWTDADIALFANWGNISYIVATFISSWIVNKKGLRWACIISAVLITTGACIRCITDQPPYITWTVNIGQFVLGLAGPICLGVQPVISAVWFPAGERTTATAFSNAMGSFGVNLQFILGPLMVSDLSHHRNSTISNESYVNVTNNSSDIVQNILTERSQIMKKMYYEAAWSGLILVLVLVYFPAKPPLPPAVTAATERLDFKTGLKSLVRLKKFWLIGFTYSVSTGVFGCWQGILDVNLKPHGISQKQAGWMGFYGGVSGSIVKVIVARFIDVFSKHIRIVLLVIYTGAVVCLTWFTLALNGVLPATTGSLFASIILGTVLIVLVAPLYFEMTCEVAYPIGEEITALVLTLLNNVTGLVFLLIQMIPHIGTSWQNWCVLGSVASCIPVLALLKERYNRLEIDENVHKIK